MPDSGLREERLLELIKYFHPYLMKYLDMIVRGHVSGWRTGRNKDTEAFLRCLIKRGTELTGEIARSTAKYLHLAFKQQDADDIYDVLIICLIRAIKNYDPNYTAKLRRIIDYINGLEKQKSFTPRQVDVALGFNTIKYLRLLSRHGFLAAQRERKKVIGYLKSDTWPPNTKVFGKGIIGFVYYVQKWFRYFLKENIERSLNSVESKGIEGGYGLMQLEHRRNIDPDGIDISDEYMLPCATGKIQDQNGQMWAADVDMVNKCFDLSGLTLDWVANTEDPLFRKLTPQERYILYALFKQEMSLKDVAYALKLDIKECKELYNQILVYLKDKAIYGREQSKSILTRKDGNNLQDSYKNEGQEL